MFIFPSNELSRLCDNSSLKTKKKTGSQPTCRRTASYLFNNDDNNNSNNNKF